MKAVTSFDVYEQLFANGMRRRIRINSRQTSLFVATEESSIKRRLRAALRKEDKVRFYIILIFILIFLKNSVISCAKEIKDLHRFHVIHSKIITLLMDSCYIIRSYLTFEYDKDTLSIKIELIKKLTKYIKEYHTFDIFDLDELMQELDLYSRSYSLPVHDELVNQHYIDIIDNSVYSTTLC